MRVGACLWEGALWQKAGIPAFLCGVFVEVSVPRGPGKEAEQEGRRARVPAGLEAGLVVRSDLAEAGMLQHLTGTHGLLRLGHLVTHTYKHPFYTGMKLRSGFLRTQGLR